MTDIIERLRHTPFGEVSSNVIPLLENAADEIERMRADIDQGAKDYCALMDRHDEQHNEIERLRDALKSIETIARNALAATEDRP